MPLTSFSEISKKKRNYMKEELITEVMQQMLTYLNNAQLKQLKQAIEQTLCHYEVTGTQVKPEENDNNDLIAMFIAAKRVEGCSERTLKYYQTTLNALVSSLGKNVRILLRRICGHTLPIIRTRTNQAGSRLTTYAESCPVSFHGWKMRNISLKVRCVVSIR